MLDYHHHHWKNLSLYPERQKLNGLNWWQLLVNLTNDWKKLFERFWIFDIAGLKMDLERLSSHITIFSNSVKYLVNWGITLFLDCSKKGNMRAHKCHIVTHLMWNAMSGMIDTMDRNNSVTSFLKDKLSGLQIPEPSILCVCVIYKYAPRNIINIILTR